MLRALILTTLLAVLAGGDAAQTPGVLRVKIVIVDAQGTAIPVPRHRLLVSDNPATAAPIVIVTRLDGTVDVKLRPGNYTVESDRAVVLHGKTYQWTQTVDVPAGRDTVLELTANNADAGPLAAISPEGGASPDDPAFLLPRWQASVVAIWTATAPASGFVVDARGLVVTSQRIVGTATSVEVQIAPAVKVTGNVLITDVARDVAVLWIDSKIASTITPLSLTCAPAAKPAAASGDRIFAIGAPMRQQKNMTSGSIRRIDPRVLITDLSLASGAAGGPVFAETGALIGLTSIADSREDRDSWDTRVVPVQHACEILATADRKLKDAPQPSGALLPVEPTRAFPVDALKEMVRLRAGSLNPYQITSSTFDITFITPVNIYGAEYQADQRREIERERNRARGTQAPLPAAFVRPLLEFGNWSDYMADLPPVLLVRVTPKLVEGFWTRVARTAVQTQGVSIPPIKRLTPGFASLRAFCGDTEVTPIHPFKLEQRISEGEAIYEGLYVYDPGALRPECGTIKLVLFSEKTPDKGDTREVEAGVIQQIWQDFAPHRAGLK